MAKNYGSTNLMNFKEAEERRQQRRESNNNFFSKLMSGSRKHTESKKYNMSANMDMASAKRAKASAESMGMKEYGAKKAADAKAAMTKAEGMSKTGRLEAEKFKRKSQSNIAGKKKESILSKFKSSKTGAEFFKKLKNK